MTSSLGKYDLLEPLGKGGFGTVYRARDTLLNVPRAVKLLHPALVADPEFIARFRLEAQIAARLEHPHIVPVYDLGELDGRFFLAMRLMPGGSLKDRLDREGRLPYAEAVRIITQVAEALDFAFRSPEKLIHRDVKPGNILLEAEGTVRLSDFGFAKAMEGEGSSSLSASGGLVGTLAYLAPEIWNSQPASPASDQYSLACVFYELITGQSLFGGGDSPLPVVMKRHLDSLALPERWPDGVPVGVSRVLSRALAKTPQERYASAGQFTQALDDVLRGAVSPLTPNQNLSPDPSPKGKGGKRPPPSEMGSIPPSPKGGSAKERGKGPGVRSAARPLPWKWLGLGAGLLAGLVLLVGVASLAMQAANDRRAAQTAEARLNLTAQALAALPSHTPEPIPFSTSATPLLPTPTHTTLPPTLTPTTLPPSPTPTLGPGSTQISPLDGMVLSYIPAGSFQMGEDAYRGLEQCQLLYESFTTENCARDWFTYEEPVHTVSLDAFWMDQTEVNNGMYAQCVAAGACSPPSYSSSYTHSSYYGDKSYAEYPVIYVDWSQAEAYCTWAGRELPTEAQREYAARGGLAGALYPWGDVFDGSLANFCDENCTFDYSNPNFNDGYLDTAPVASYPANGYGLFDITGNVWEWVADWYGAYSSTSVYNPSGPASGSYKILRGGSWYDSGFSFRVSQRNWVAPGYTYVYIGFRCARSP